MTSSGSTRASCANNMGVDLATRRSRIGAFSMPHGLRQIASIEDYSSETKWTPCRACALFTTLGILLIDMVLSGCTVPLDYTNSLPVSSAAIMIYTSGVTCCIRTDRGTEDVCIEDLQNAIRWSHVDDVAGENSVLYGSPHRNQTSSFSDSQFNFCTQQGSVMAYQSVLCYLFGSLIRLWLFRTSFPKWLSSRNEVVTPLTSWERVQEGMALQETYISPYAGDIFHETPILLRLLQYVAKVPQMTDILFVFMDVLIGMVLSRIAMEFGRYMLERQAQGVSRYAANVEKLVLRGSDLKWLQTYVIVVHFLNPYSIAVCLSKSTAVFTNLATLLTILNALQGNEILCSLFLALAAYQSLYPFVYIVPVALLFYKRAYPNATCYTSAEAVGSYLYTSACFLIFILLLIGVSYGLENSWDFLYSTYGFILTVPDLSPNIGVFWYFFTEMFEHFRIFFICVFQINAVVYTVPLAVKLRDSPVFQLYMLVFLTSIFKSYPSYADAALFLSLLPLWQHCFSYMRNKFVVGCMFLSCSVVAPILWHLWIYAGSANANFYFAITLTFSTAEIFLVTDLLFAFLRRQYDLNHGMDQKLDDGKPAQIVLD